MQRQIGQIQCELERKYLRRVSGSALPQMQPWSDSLSIFGAQLQNEVEKH